MNAITLETQHQENNPVQDCLKEIIPVHEENQDSGYIKNLFSDENGFGEGDCPGL